MKKSIHILFALLIFFTTVASTNSIPMTTCRWELTFSDDFVGQTLDQTLWSTRYPSGGGGERQYYAPEALVVENGLLNINAIKMKTHGYPYRSGIITTQTTFAQQYGRFEIRAKLPSGKGFWSAFWLLPVHQNFPLEIDVFEMLGHDPYTLYISNHWKAGDRSHQINTIPIFGSTDYSAEFHTYEIVWSPTKIDWIIDGELQHNTVEGIPSVPMFMLINLAVGGTWPGNPDASTHFPGVMQIDSVHVYKQVCELPQNKRTPR